MGKKDNPANLQSLWQVAWVLTLIAVVAAATAVGVGHSRIVDVDEYAAGQVCAAAQGLLGPQPSSTPSPGVVRQPSPDQVAAARTAVQLFAAAQVTSQNAERSSGCYQLWRRAQLIAANLSSGDVAAACTRAADALRRREGLPSAGASVSPATSELLAVGVTDTNYVWLDEDCATTWRLARLITPASVSASPTPSSPVPSALSSPSTAASVPAPISTPTHATAPERWGEQWDGFVTHNATPLATQGSFVLGGWLALFVLARLLVETPMRRHLVSSRPDRQRIGALGWTLLILTPCLMAGAGVAVRSGWLMGPAVIVLFLALAALSLVASLSLAAWLATLLKLTITVESESTLRQTQIVERLRALASGASGSIEIQSASTIENVSTALTALSKADWIAAVQKVVLFLVGISPWQVTVSANGREAFVTLARNGRTVHAATVQTQGSGLEPLRTPPPPLADDDILAVFVAAEILLAMRPWYAEDFDRGLNGATKARSVALQHIAIRWYMGTHDATDAVTLLRAAVASDPSNQLAAATWEHARWRGSSDPGELRDYGKWLDRQLGDGREQP